MSSHCGGAAHDGGTLIEDLPGGLAAGVLLNMMDDPRHNADPALGLAVRDPEGTRGARSTISRTRADAIVAAAVAKGSCDFLVDVAAELPLQAIAALLGLPQDDRHELFTWAEAMLDYNDRELGESSDETIAANTAMFAYGKRLLDEQAGRPTAHVHATGDILDAVVREAVATELEQQMFFTLLVAAGTETTRNSIAVGLLALVENQDQWRAPQRRPVAAADGGGGDAPVGDVDHYNRRTATSASRSASTGSRRATRSRCGGPPPTATTTCSPSRSGSTSAATRTRTRVRPRHALLPRCRPRPPGDAAAVHRAARPGRRLRAGRRTEWTRTNKHNGIRHLPVTLTPR